MPAVKKAKVKSKPKRKAKTVAKSKAKQAKKPKLKSKVKPKTKAKPKAKPKAKAKRKLKAKSEVKAKVKPKINFNEVQKKNLLELIEKIVNLRRNEKGGLGTFDAIDRILDKYNQHYTNTVEKFDAIIEYGMTKDPALVPKSVFVFSINKEQDEIDLYALLEQIWKGHLNYNDARERMNSIYTDYLEIKAAKHLKNEFKHHK